MGEAQTDVDIDGLVHELQCLKAQQSILQVARLKCEQSLIAALGERDEGAETHTMPDGTKITITSKIDRKLDSDAWLKIRDAIPEWLREVVRESTAYALDVKGVRYIQQQQPEVYAVLAQAMTVKKAKSSVDIKQPE